MENLRPFFSSMLIGVCTWLGALVLAPLGALPGALLGASPGALLGALPGTLPGALLSASPGTLPGALFGAPHSFTVGFHHLILVPFGFICPFFGTGCLLHTLAERRGKVATTAFLRVAGVLSFLALALFFLVNGFV